MPGAQREDLALENVHVSRALRILSTRVFLTREACSEWECLIGSASLPAPLALKQLECRHGGHG
jgi:hypothetical protein